MLKLDRFNELMAYYNSCIREINTFFSRNEEVTDETSLMLMRCIERLDIDPFSELHKIQIGDYSTQFRNELDENLMLSVINHSRYFNAIYTDGIIPIITFFKSSLIKVEKELIDIGYNINATEEEMLRNDFYPEEAMLHGLLYAHILILECLAKSIQDHASTFGIKNLPRPEEVVQERSNNSFNYLEELIKSKSKNGKNNSVYRPIIYAYMYSSVVDPKRPKQPQRADILRYASELGSDISPKYLLGQWYSTNPRGKNYKPPTLSEIKKIMRLLQGNSLALKHAEKEILKALGEDSEKGNDAKKYFKNIQ
jgi:hypothetical protein